MDKYMKKERVVCRTRSSMPPFSLVSLFYRKSFRISELLSRIPCSATYQCPRSYITNGKVALHRVRGESAVKLLYALTQ